MKYLGIFSRGFCLLAVAALLVGCSSTGGAGPKPLLSIDFEKGLPGNMQSWGEPASGSSVQDGVSHDGSRALVVRAGGEGGAGIVHGLGTAVLELQPKTTYKLSAWGKNSAAASPASEVGIKWKLNPMDSEEHSQFIFFEGDEWQEGSITFTTPLVLASAVFFIWKPDTEVEFYVDNVLLVRE
jgi:hypothetical protein